MYKYSAKHLLDGFKNDIDRLIRDLTELAEEEGSPLSEEAIKILRLMNEQSKQHTTS